MRIERIPLLCLVMLCVAAGGFIEKCAQSRLSKTAAEETPPIPETLESQVTAMLEVCLDKKDKLLREVASHWEKRASCEELSHAFRKQTERRTKLLSQCITNPVFGKPGETTTWCENFLRENPLQ